MATITQPTKKRESNAGAATQPTAPRGGPRWPRWRWLALAAAVLLLVVWFLPTLVANSPVLNWVLASAASDLNGKLSTRSASLGWLSPVRLFDVQLSDPTGQPVLEAPALETERSLLGLVFSGSSPGRVRLDRPKLNLVLRPDGSNVEDLLTKYLTPDQPMPEQADVALEIVDGTVLVTDAQARQTWQIDDLDVTFTLPGDLEKPIEVAASAKLANPERPGRFNLAAKIARTRQPDGTPAGPAGASGQLTTKAENVPLALFAPLLRRALPHSDLAGWLATDLSVQFTGLSPDGSFVVGGSTAAEGLVFAAEQLGQDRVRLQSLRAQGQGSWQKDRLAVEQLAVESDVASLAISGTIDPGQVPAGDRLSSLLRQTCRVEGRVDLARLAAMLPATLRIRPQTQVTSGQLQVSLQSGPGPQGVEWHGRVEASGLAAINAGRELSWPQPLLVTISAHDSPQGPVVDSLTCQSEFLQVQAAGTPEQCTASAKFDIDRLAGQLSGLIDLGGWRLSGSGGLTAGWSRSPQQQFSARAELQVTGFELAVPGRPAWKEDRLAAVLAAQGQTDFTPQTRVDAGGLTVESGADRLEIALRAPVAGLGDGGVWPVEVRSTGQLAQWLARLSPWISLDGWQIGGSYDLAVQATASQSEVRVDQGRVTLAELRVEGHGLAVYEPRTELTVSAGGWERANRGVDVAAAALAGTSLSARADKSAVRLPEAGPAEVQLAGQVDYDLEKITPWLNGLVGAEVQLAGRGSSPIAVRGPLTPEGLEAHTQAGWAYAGLYGFEIGPGTLKADLAKGLLSIPPTQVEASGGRILLGGQLRLAPEPQELVVPPGRVVDQVEVNPRMCYYALKYIAPVVAGVASADGRFSIELDQCRIPLADPAKGELSGRMIVHSVRVGPGPLARELAVLLGYQSPAELTRESVIDFRMADGRVYHRGLETHFGQVTMTTSGSVGLDQSLSLVAEMPIPPTWLANRPLLNSALRNQTIRIPIGGTLEKPVLDAQAIQELSRQFLQNATRNLLEDQLNRFFPQQ